MIAIFKCKISNYTVNCLSLLSVCTLLNLQSCDNSKSKYISASNEPIIIGIPINIDTVKQIKVVYPITKSGIHIYSLPNERKIIDDNDKSTVFGVIEISGQWYGIVSNYRPYTKVYIKKSDVVEETQISLTNYELNEIYSGEEESVKYERDDNLEVILISKAQFYENKKTSIEYFVDDSKTIRRVGSSFTLQFSNEQKSYKSTELSETAYIGQLPIFNSYLIRETVYEAEESEHILVSKTSGKSLYRFPYFPYISNDKQFIMCVGANLYRDFADMSIFEIKRDGFIRYANAQFKNWMPAESEEIFWGSDGYFYLPVLPSVAYWQKGGKEEAIAKDYNYRYVKIKIIGPSEEEEL